MRRIIRGAYRRARSTGQRLLSSPGPPLVPSGLARRPDQLNVLYLHHSTGHVVWNAGVPRWLSQHPIDRGVQLVERAYPHAPHQWSNDPYDYWNLWVNHRGENRYRRQETLEELTTVYDVIVLKHCFTGSLIEPDERSASPSRRTLSTYRRQYDELAEAMRAFPQTRFLLWTLPPLVPAHTTPEQVARAQEFTAWVRQVWAPNAAENIYLWDYRALATDADGLPVPGYAVSETDSHPSPEFAAQVVPDLGRRLLQLLDGGR